MKRIVFAALILTLLAACSPAKATPTSSVPQPSYPWAPQPGDAPLTRGNVYLDEMDLVTMESYPLQFALHLKGNLPTPCHSLRVATADPDANDRIAVDVYSVADPDEVCVQMLEPFEATIPLGSFPAGHYTVWVNGEQAGEFDS